MRISRGRLGQQAARRCQRCSWHTALRVEQLEGRCLLSFLTAPSLEAGLNPRSVVVADVNGDGLPDLITANYGSNDVSVLLGNGDGSFQAARNFSAGAGPVSVTVGDFTGTGTLDLAVADNGDPHSGMGQGVSILLGNGGGTFQPAHLLAAGDSPTSVALGDFTSTGSLDLAVANAGSNNVSVLLGNGDGTFQPAWSLAAGSNPESVVVGDLDGDGIPDLAVANSLSNDVSVFLGNGDGSFRAAPNLAAGMSPDAVALGDFTGSGIQDLAVANSGGTAVSILLGNGDGTFQAAGNSFAGFFPQSVAVADLNGDGIPDLAVVDKGISGQGGDLRVLLGNGDGTFKAALAVAAGTNPFAVVAGDVNGDGVPDLVTANSVSGDVSVLLGNGDGTFSHSQTPHAASGGNTPYGVAVADLNGDGIPDLAVVNQGTSANNYADGSVAILLGNGDGTFQPAQTFAAGVSPTSIVVGDFNGDGIPDLAVTNVGTYSSYTDNGVGVLLGNGDGTFQVPREITLPAREVPYALAVADFNGDGIQDLAVADVYGQDIGVLLGNGDGTFQPARTFATGGNPLAVVVGDFNGDGIPDLAVADNPGLNNPAAVSVLLGNGDGTFAPGQVIQLSGTAPASLAVGDFNGDGIQDLAVVDNQNDYVGVLLGNGNGTFRLAYAFTTGLNPLGVVVGDFNGDGIQDVAVANYTSGDVNVRLGNGDGTFQAASSYAVDAGPNCVVAADLNGDGYADLVVTNTLSNDVSILLNDGNWPNVHKAAPHHRPAQRPALRGSLTPAEEQALPLAPDTLPGLDNPVATPVQKPIDQTRSPQPPEALIALAPMSADERPDPATLAFGIGEVHRLRSGPPVADLGEGPVTPFDEFLEVPGKARGARFQTAENQAR